MTMTLPYFKTPLCPLWRHKLLILLLILALSFLTYKRNWQDLHVAETRSDPEMRDTENHDARTYESVATGEFAGTMKTSTKIATSTEAWIGEGSSPSTMSTLPTTEEEQDGATALVEYNSGATCSQKAASVLKRSTTQPKELPVRKAGVGSRQESAARDEDVPVKKESFAHPVPVQKGVGLSGGRREADPVQKGIESAGRPETQPVHKGLEPVAGPGVPSAQKVSQLDAGHVGVPEQKNMDSIIRREVAPIQKAIDVNNGVKMMAIQKGLKSGPRNAIEPEPRGPQSHSRLDFAAVQQDTQQNRPAVAPPVKLNAAFHRSENGGAPRVQRSVSSSKRSPRCNFLTAPNLEEIKRLDPSAKFYFEGPFYFLPNMWSPCWKSDLTKEGVACLPYFYVAGFPKCGTTDLYVLLSIYPQVVRPVAKETHWVTRHRFVGYNGRNKTLKDYVENFSPVMYRAVSPKSTYRADLLNPQITGDYSVTTAYEHLRWETIPGNQWCDEPLILNADLVRHMNPRAKIIFTVRNPTTRTHSDYFHWQRTKSPETFESFVHSQINWLKDCFEKNTVRQCAYTFPEPNHVRLKISLYHVFIEDWLKRFPRDQIYVVRLEDWALNPVEELVRLFKFLELDVPSRELIEVMRHRVPANYGEVAKDQGLMSNHTKAVLDSFFRPFNARLAQLLGNRKFLWEDE